MGEMADQHAFLSYVHEDAAAADEVQAALEDVGVRVWRDRDALGPGDVWKARIREAIQGGSLAFVALLSSNSVAKARSYQRPELLLAAEEYQLHPPEAHWLFPVRLDDCRLPELDLGGGRDLSMLQWTDLFGSDAQRGLRRLIVAVRDLLVQQQAPLAVTDVVVARDTGEGGRAGASIKALLRDPNGDIALEERIDEVAEQACTALADPAEFPREAPGTAAETAQLVRRMLQRYEETLEPLRECLTLAGTWAHPRNDHAWTRAIERVADVCLAEQDGPVSRLLLEVRRYPLLWLGYAVTIAAIDRDNHSPSRAVLLDAQVVAERITGPVLAFVNEQRTFEAAPWLASAVVLADETGAQIDDAFVRAVELQQRRNRHTPLADLMHRRLRQRLRREIPRDARFTELFDRASILFDATSVDLDSRSTAERFLPAWPGFGAYTWRYRRARPPLEVVMAEELDGGAPFVDAGWFGGDITRARSAFQSLAEQVEDVRRRIR